MEKFAVIIPDRNDRPDFTKFCLHQLARMTRKPDQIFHINWEPIAKGFDLVERVLDGVCKAKAAGYDLVFIIENDDYYPEDYFERFGKFDADFFGDDATIYYHLKNREHGIFDHPLRSSLFTTGFRISSIGTFKWGGDQFLDLRLWSYAKEKVLTRAFRRTGTIGMKHGQGLCGGKGHKMSLKFGDSHLLWLRKNVDRESYLFYSEMSRKLWEKELAK